jgi:hypothetical protein
MILINGCALDEALAQNYKANQHYYKTKGNKITKNRSDAKARFIKDKTAELISMYGKQRGYLIACKILTDENIQYNFDSQNFYPFVDNEILIKYINETRDLETNSTETIIIIKK